MTTSEQFHFFKRIWCWISPFYISPVDPDDESSLGSPGGIKPLKFRRHDEPNSIQLFYDLFFVANLTACTTNHEINDADTLYTYFYFFSFLWSTWFTTVIFDVRFTIDSWFTRVTKAFSFGIMTAFAMSTVHFNTTDQGFGHDAKAISYILMSSRLALALQYVSTTIAVYRSSRNVRYTIPFILSICTHIIAAFIFLALALSKSDKDVNKIPGWVITSFFEILTLLVISYKWNETMKFDYTNIVERMGALTLIIIGEGTIGLVEAVSFILENSVNLSWTIVGLVIAAVLLMYVTWMLYFDHTDEFQKPGSRISKRGYRCQIWLGLHFVLHCAILMTLEGSTRFIYWANAVEVFNPVIDAFQSLWILSAPNGTTLALQLGNLSTAYPFLAPFFNSSDIRGNLTDLNHLGNLTAGGWHSGNSQNDSQAQEIVFSIWESILFETNALFDVKIDKSLSDDYTAAREMINYAYKDWYITFFVGSGCVLIVLALCRYFGEKGPEDGTTGEDKTRKNAHSVFRRKKAHHRRPWIILIPQCLIGVALALISLLARLPFSQPWSRFMNSPWIIPCVLLSFCLGMLKLFLEQPIWERVTDADHVVIVLDNAFYSSHHRASPYSIHHPPLMDGLTLEKSREELEAEIDYLKEKLEKLSKQSVVPEVTDVTQIPVTLGTRKEYRSLLPHSPDLHHDRASTFSEYSNATEIPLLMLTPEIEQGYSDAASATMVSARSSVDFERGDRSLLRRTPDTSGHDQLNGTM